MPLPDHELEALGGCLIGLEVEGACLEIGTAYGRTLIHLMSLFEPGDRPPFVVIDPMTYFPDQAEKVRANLAEEGFAADEVRILEMTSARALAELPADGEPFGGSLALVFVDGDHRITGVTVDLRWARRIAVGGAICFHDYRPDAPGLRLAVDRFLRRNPHYTREALVGSLLIVRKTGPSSGREVGALDRLYALLLAPLLRLQRSVRKRLPRADQAPGE